LVGAAALFGGVLSGALTVKSASDSEAVSARAAPTEWVDQSWLPLHIAIVWFVRFAGALT